MDSPEAKVVAVGTESVTVSVDAAATCQRCAAGRGCGAGLFGQRRGPSRLEVKVAAGVSLNVGDSVRLDLAPALLLRAAWLAYGLPLAGLMLAVVVAAQVAPANDLVAVLFAALGLVLGLWLGRRTLMRNDCLRHCVPIASEKLPAFPTRT